MHKDFEHVVDELIKQTGATGRLARDLRQEFTSHFYEVSAELLAEGLSEEEMIDEAMKRFGNTEDIAKTFENLYHIPMQKIAKKILAASGVVLGIFLFVDFLYVGEFDSSDFQKAIERKYDVPYEIVREYVHSASYKPCKTDGIGLDNYFLALGVSFCDVTWIFDENRFLWQVSGPTMTKETFSLPADTADSLAAKMLYSVQRDLQSGEGILLTKAVHEPIKLLLDTGVVTVPVEQLGSMYQVKETEYIELLVVLQKNSAIDIGLHESEMIPYAGLIGREPGDEVWVPLFDVTDPFAALPEGMGKMNVQSVFALAGELFVDVVDDQGAGSGEGNLLRLAFSGQDPDTLWSYDATASVEKWKWDAETWKENVWLEEGCFYFLPEEYVEGSWDLTPALTCSGKTFPFNNVLSSATLYVSDTDEALIARYFFSSLAEGWYSEAALFYEPQEDYDENFTQAQHIQNRAWLLKTHCESADYPGLCTAPQSITLKQIDEATGVMTFDVVFLGFHGAYSEVREVFVRKALNNTDYSTVIDPLPVL